MREVTAVYPSSESLSESIPPEALRFLKQAIESIHAPDGAVMLAASAVDAMLKVKGYKDGSLYARIKKAADDHVITSDMAIWAHQVRLDANDPRHADESSIPHDEASAKRVVEFTKALAQFLFVLPSQVTRGVKDAGGRPIEEGGSVPSP